ncbi:MAG TPA: hypothetical protein VF748_16135 [Candidatus Acidoferrum sp.]
MNLKDIWTRVRPPVQEPEKPTFEQMKEQIELAEQFDRLQHLPVWEAIIRRLGAEVNGELVEAAKYKYEPVRQTAHTVRWDAKREMLDGLLGWMESVQAERNRIIEDFRDIDATRGDGNGRSTGSTARN